jgi:hypothetical protein
MNYDEGEELRSTFTTYLAEGDKVNYLHFIKKIVGYMKTIKRKINLH